MHATILRTRDEVQALAPQWDELPPLSPFSSGDFACDWLSCTPEASPFVIAVHDGGTLMGVAPWCLARDFAGSTLLTGIGRESAWYHDPLVRNGAVASEVHRAIGQALRPPHWDAIDLILQADASIPLVRVLERLGVAVSRRPADRQSHLIALDADWTTSWERFPDSFRKSLKRRRRRLESLPHQFLMVEGDQALECLEELIRLNRLRWQTGQTWEPAYAVMRANTRTLLARGELRFFVLMIEGRIAALDYQVRKGNRSSMIMGNYHPDFADLSPGNALLVWALEQLNREGIQWVDMGPGNYAWKNQIRSEQVEIVRTQVGLSLRGMALVSWRGMIKPQLQPVT